MRKFLILIAILVFSVSARVFAQNTVTVDDSWIGPGESKTFTSDTEWILDGYVFVEEGATLTIEPGTVIKANEGSEADASALIIARGAQIFATGTPDKPIIFTSVLDDVNDLTDIPLDRTGLWGGVIILGRSEINIAGGVEQIEGIPENEPRGEYGGGDNPVLDDNSGIFRYVSIRHGGTNIGANNEINGLTLGAVGSGTLIEYVEVWSNDDDGFEFFGGTVNTKYLVASYCHDDAFDYDQGFRGKGQFWFAIQPEDAGNYGGEHDGGSSPDDVEPFAIPTILNATYIGSGPASERADSQGFLIRDNAGGNYHNSIFAEFPGGGIDIEDLTGTDVQDSRDRLEAGDLNFTNNLWWNIGFGANINTIDAISPDRDYSQDFVRSYLPANDNFVDDPMFTGISRNLDTPDGTLDPRVDREGPAFTSPLYETEDDFFSLAPYYGAFGANNLWVKGWTFLDQVGILTDGVEQPNVVEVFDADINEGDNVTWTSDNEYILNGFVFVEEGATLTIEPGTVIKGRQGQGADASALIIARGAQIFANGEADNPVIFTSILDDVNDPNDVPFGRSGLWGGLIVLGSATINIAGGVENIEGIPINEPRGQYGGTNDDDNSGVIRFVSVRHGGSNIGQNNEINGISFGGVGRGTVVEYCEVYANEDDGFEFFGGTVNTKYLVSSYNGDDAFDYDQGYRGQNQFWFAIQSEDAGNYGGEHDGGKSPDDSEPFAIPTVYNATYIGSGTASNREDSQGFLIRDNAGGKYRNSLFMDFPGGGIDIEDLSGSETQDSRDRLEAGDLEFTNNIWWNIGTGANLNTINGVSPDRDYSQDFVRTYLGQNTNLIENPELASISRTTGNNDLDPRPSFTGPCFDEANIYSLTEDEEDAGFFEQAPFIGAFGSNNLWVKGWTFLDEANILSDGVGAPGIVNVFDTDINPGDDVTWTNDNEYLLNGFVFVEEGATLTIEPGTVIKGKQGTGVNASALIIARGGRIIARGDAQNPIIFTSELDDVNDPNDLPLDRAGLWGGLVVLGSATINVGGGVENIEGIPVNEPRGEYGGNNDNDNSGIIEYVSIRHGGSNIGQNNEINGLSLGGVGSGTQMNYIEVFANDDDGIEFFGGTASIKYAVVAFSGDDSFDYDQGWRGKGQFWFTIQAEDRGNYGGEHDGGSSPDDSEPFAIPLIYNVTYIGSGLASNREDSQGFLIRDNAGGKYYNSIFTEFPGGGVDIEDLSGTGTQDSRDRLEAGELELTNNLWWNIGTGANSNTLEGISPDRDYSQDFVRTYLADNNNFVQDADLGGISRTNDGGLDPRPNASSPAFSLDRRDYPDDNFFDAVDYYGAFDNNDENNWLLGWTYLDELGYLGDLAEEGNSSVEDVQAGTDMLTVYPNPVNTDARIMFNVNVAGTVRITLVDVQGNEIAVVTEDTFAQGIQEISWNAGNVNAGNYFIKLENAGNVYTQKFVVVK